MDHLHSIVGKVEKQVESIIRGGSVGGQVIPTQNGRSMVVENVRELFEYLIAPSSQINFTNVDDKTVEVNNAVRLHNKVRNLSPIAHAELRAIAKACAAWMLMLFNQPVPKSICAVIKLLSRAGQETQTFSDSISLKCCTAATDLWKRINIQILSQTMATLELQDIKVAVFQAYMDQADILVKTDAIKCLRWVTIWCAFCVTNFINNLMPFKLYQQIEAKVQALHLSNIRGAISGAFDIVQSLPEGLKVYFAEQTILLGGRLSELNATDEAIHILQISVSSIDLLGSAVSDGVTRYQICKTLQPLLRLNYYYHR